MNSKNLLVILTVMAVAAMTGCSSGSGSSPASQNKEQALNEGMLITGAKQTDCSDSFVLEAVNILCELFGAGSCISQNSSCNSYSRQLFTGTTIASEGSSWNSRGGSGELMADATVCILRELSPKVQNGGPLVSNAMINIGIGSVLVRQEVGYLDFDRVNARFKGYRKIYFELPVLGKFDAVAQNIDITKTFFGGHNFPAPWPFAGNYSILFGQGLNLTTEEKSKSLDIKPPAFDVTTPIGVFSAQPTFEYRSYTTVADSPYATDHTYIILPPDDKGNVAVRLTDLYGILPGVNVTKGPQPNSGTYTYYREGWISQIGLGNRGTGTGSEGVWAPPASGPFSRPDYDATGTLNFLAYTPRSTEENQPSVYVKAAAKVKYPKNPYDLLPAWVQKLSIVGDILAYIEVAPTIEAGAAGQFGIALSEGTNFGPGSGEFGFSGSRLAGLGIYSGVKANAKFYIDTLLRIKVSASFPWPVGDVDLIDIDPHFPIPLAGGTPTASGVKFASAYSTSSSAKPDFPETLDSLNTFNVSKPDPKAFITQCYAPENELASEPTPTPTSEKGDPADLFESEVWPCNICIATNEVKSQQTGSVLEPAHSEFLMPAATLPTAWKCDSTAKSGCMDKCLRNPVTGALTVIGGPLDIANGIPASDPKHDFFKSCMAPCGYVFGSVAGGPCLKSSDVTFSVDGLAGPFSITTQITGTFSTAMDTETINTDTFTVYAVSGPEPVKVEGTIRFNEMHTSATFVPAVQLSYGTTYSVTLTRGVTDSNRNPLPAEISTVFTTEDAPR